MSKILAVFGATGKQGGSVVRSVVNDPDLFKNYTVRAITRNPNSEQAKRLPKEVDIVQGDVNDRGSLETALAGAHTVFIVNTPSFGPNAVEDEFKSVKAVADVAVENGCAYIIFSTLPGVSDISDGKYKGVTPFDAKAKAEQYIRGLPVKSAFYSPGSFMQNFQPGATLGLTKLEDGSWEYIRNDSPKTRMPLIDAEGDTGKFIGAILAEPDKYTGKILHAASAMYTVDEIIALLSKSAGQRMVVKQIPTEDLVKALPFAGDLFANYYLYLEEFDYWGPGSAQMIKTGSLEARGKLSTFEEYLEKNPFKV